MHDRREILTGALAAAGLTLAGGPALAAAREAVIGLSEQRGHFVVEVAINGRPGARFLFDTGTTTHVISAPLAKALMLRQVGRRPMGGYRGLQDVARVAADDLNVGGVSLGRAELAVWPAEQLQVFDGLIGYPSIMPSCVLDLAASQVRLGGAPPQAMAMVRANVTQRGATLVGGIEGAEGSFVFDTGARFCTLSPAYEARIRQTEAFRDARKLTYRMADGSTRVRMFQPREIRFGDFRIPGPVLHLDYNDAGEAVFTGTDGLFGVDVIRPYTWALNQDTKTLQALPGPEQRTSWHGSGLLVGPDGVVMGLADGGPAQEAGLRLGQKLARLDGRPPGLAPAAVRDRPVRRVAEVKEGGRLRSIEFTTRALI